MLMESSNYLVTILSVFALETKEANLKERFEREKATPN